MPVDLGMFLSHTGTNLFDYSSFVENRFSFSQNYEVDGFVRSYSFPRSHILIPKDQQRISCYAKKENLDSYSFESNQKQCRKSTTDGNIRKKVSFADDKGLSLVEIREIPGHKVRSTSLMIPAVQDDKPESIFQKHWKVASENPPWSDCKLFELLEKNKVVLESVTIKSKTEETLESCLKDKWSDNFRNVLRASCTDNEFVIKGTIKVKNLSFEKKVFARITFDRWLSLVDIKANYLKLEKKPENHNEYNTFTFCVAIPPSALKYEVIEFCIGYFSNDQKYWDNNGGINYRLVTEIVKKTKTATHLSHNHCKKSNDRITLSLTENIERFSEIDSWNNFINNQPYW